MTELQFEDLKAQYAIKYKLDKSSLEFLENRNVVELLKKLNKNKEIKKNKKALKKEEANYTNNKSSNFISVIIDAIKNLSKNIAFKVLSYL